MFTVVSTPTCGYCHKAKELLALLGREVKETSLDTPEKLAAFKAAGFDKVPQIYHNGLLIGGFSDLVDVINGRFNKGA